MAVSQYNPTSDLLGPLVDEFFRPQSGRGMLRAPEADVVETMNEIQVVLDAPGLSPDEIDISLENNVLTVSGERRPEWSAEEGARLTWHLAERRYGKFSRSFVLPRDVDQERIAARFENGVLSITIPKSERARRRRIEVQGGSRGDGSGAVQA
jgi:HSP20 family protein